MSESTSKGELRCLVMIRYCYCWKTSLQSLLCQMLNYTCLIYDTANDLSFRVSCLWGNIAGTEVRIFVFVFVCSLTSFMVWKENDDGYTEKKAEALYIGNERLFRRGALLRHNVSINVKGWCCTKSIGGVGHLTFGCRKRLLNINGSLQSVICITLLNSSW